MVCVCALAAAVESLGLALEHLPHGLQELVLANCKITPRGEGHAYSSSTLLRTHPPIVPKMY